MDGWYLGPAFHNYQCYRVWVPCTHDERIVDTISFFPKAVPLHDLTHKDAAIHAAHELTHALQQRRFRGTLAQFHDNHLTSLCKLSKIFHTIALGVETIAPGVDTTIKNICHQYPIPHQHHLLTPQPLLPLPNTSLNFHIMYAHARHIHTTLPPSPTAKPASLWNTETSSQTPPHVPYGCAPPQTNLVASRRASQTTVWNLPTLYSLFLSPRSPNTNDLPMPVLSAATVPKMLNLTAHASPLVATSLITLAI